MEASTRGIERRRDRQGGDACLAGTRVPVWVLENCRRLEMSDADILRAYPSLTAADLEAAWDYAAANRDGIDRAVRENEEGAPGFAG